MGLYDFSEACSSDAFTGDSQKCFPRRKHHSQKNGQAAKSIYKHDMGMPTKV